MNNISIKGITSSLLLGLGSIVIMLSIIAVIQLRSAAETAQIASLTRVIEVGAAESYKKMETLSQDLANYTKQTEGFKNTIQTLFKDKSSENKNSVQKLLNEQFHQRYVTSGILKLAAIRVYDLDFSLVAGSSEGSSSRLPNHLHAILAQPAKIRNGADRLKVLANTWTHNDETFYSSIYPLGGLFIKGYMEVIIYPEFNLRDVKDILQLPLTISSVAGKQLFQSERWNKLKNEHSLPITFFVKDGAGKPALKMEALQDMTALHSSMSKTQWIVVSTFASIIAVCFLIVITILNKHLFKPAQQLVNDINECANGNLALQINASGLKEIFQLNRALNTLVEKLRDQVQVIGEDSDKLASASQTMSEITGQTSYNIITQRNETDQVATAINEMSASASEVSKNALSASESAKQAQQEAHKGQAIVTKTIDSISEVATEVSKAADVIQKLQNESHNIGAVLDVIRGIAEQTNLLALNAAIEAARAGEQGRGFAVVADEVRTLASRTQESTQEIHSMIERLQGGANDAVSVMEESKARTEDSVQRAADAGQSLQTITGAVNDISDMNLQIAQAAQEQSSVVEVINRNISNITDLADKTSDGAEQLTINSTQLTEMASHLKGLVSQFKLS